MGSEYRKNGRREDGHSEDDFKQSHGGQQLFRSGAWGESEEFGKNTQYRESDSSERTAKLKKPFDSERLSREFNGPTPSRPKEVSYRSRTSEPYTGGQFARSHFGLGGQSSRDWPSGAGLQDPNQGNYRGLGPKGYQRSDERIREDVCEALYRNPHVDARDIEVSVIDGVVVLAGTVEDRLEKREAEICSEEVLGVRDIQNDLELRTLLNGASPD
jgi:hypothetical protein